MTQPLSALLLQLYRIARGVPSSGFRDAALDALSEHAPFDAATWDTFVLTSAGARDLAVHAHNVSVQCVGEYEAVRRFDTMAAKALARPGTTVRASLLDTRPKSHPAMLAHARKWGLDGTLRTVHVDPLLHLCTAVSLYRGSAAWPFSEGERKLKQQVMPHLVEAWNLNALLFVERLRPGNEGAGRASALIDRNGTIRNADAALVPLLRAEFPDWEGPQFPVAVTKHLLHVDGESYRGDRIVASRARTLDDGLSLISVRPVAGIDRLSARERIVAREFADGRTHKQIAQAQGISPATVRNQLQSAYQKLRVRTKIELARQLGGAT
jgi:DNA-binding CsgD family transcriptional regulator